MREWQYASTRCCVETMGSMVQARVQGALTVEDAGHLIADARHWAAAPAAQVVDYSECVVQLSPEVLFAAARKARPRDLSTAFVIAPDQLALFREYCRMHLERGVLKVPFTDVESAVRWAASQAQVEEYWQRLARSRQSCP